MLLGVKRREFIALVGGATAWPLAARAQLANLRAIGYLHPSSSAQAQLFGRVLFDALSELGWTEGKNIAVERRYADNRLERLHEVAAELARLNVEVILAAGTLGPVAAKQATSTIPIVMTAAGDPLGTGLVASLARPGGNVTGMSLMVPDIGEKRLGLLKELLPGLSRAAVLWNAANPYSAIVFKEIQMTGPKLGIAVQSLQVRGPDDFDGAFDAVRKERPDALITIEDPLTVSYRDRIAQFTTADKFPSLHGLREFVTAGGLMSYGANIADLYRRAAGYVDKILKGAKPADLPVQQVTNVRLIVNLKTAKSLGLTIPLPLLGRADEVIE
jgi:putative tryptophan/tyrosine transport system substrate-binding protein